MGGDEILLLLLDVLSLRNGGGTGLPGSLCILYAFRLRFDMDFGRLSGNGKGFVCYCFAGVTVKEDACSFQIVLLCLIMPNFRFSEIWQLGQ